jgi:hypothetical protein
MKKIYTSLVFCFVAFGMNAKNNISNQKNDLLLTKVLKQLNLKETDILEELYAIKTIPYNESLTILAIPKITKQEIDSSNNDYYEFDLYVLVVESASGKIKNKFFEQDALTSDAIVLNSLEIDTGLYFLDKNIRAFGIRVNYRGSSGPNPYSKTDLSLFINDKNSLKRVLENYPISEYHGEWNMNCFGEFETIESTIDIDKTKSNNFFNLKIKQKIINQINTKFKDDCIDK